MDGKEARTTPSGRQIRPGSYAHLRSPQRLDQLANLVEALRTLLAYGDCSRLAQPRALPRLAAQLGVSEALLRQAIPVLLSEYTGPAAKHWLPEPCLGRLAALAGEPDQQPAAGRAAPTRTTTEREGA